MTSQKDSFVSTDPDFDYISNLSEKPQYKTTEKKTSIMSSMIEKSDLKRTEDEITCQQIVEESFSSKDDDLSDRLYITKMYPTKSLDNNTVNQEENSNNHTLPTVDYSTRNKGIIGWF